MDWGIAFNTYQVKKQQMAKRAKNISNRFLSVIICITLILLPAYLVIFSSQKLQLTLKQTITGITIAYSVGLVTFILQEFIRTNREKKYYHFCKKEFSNRAYEEILKQVNYDSLCESGLYEQRCLGYDIGKAKSNAGTTVIIGALDNLLLLNELLLNAEELVISERLPANSSLWLYLPEALQNECRSKLPINSQSSINVIIQSVGTIS